MRNVLLLDGDLILYKACAAAEKEVNWEGDIWSIWTNVEEVKDVVTRTVEALATKLSGEAVFCLSDWTQTRHRELLCNTYKAGRGRKPCGYAAVRDWATSAFTCTWKPGLEADDCMGILATKVRTGTNFIIVTDDKDLLQIPGNHYYRGEHRTVSEAEGDFQFWMQTLTGDPTDGYPGCPGVGPKKAEALLSGVETIEEAWPTIVKAYAKAGLTEEDVLLQARLARILRVSDWDSEKQEPILWTPPPSIK